MMTNHNPKPSHRQLQFHCRIVLTSHDPRAGSELPPCRVLTCGPEALLPPFNKPLPSVHPERGSNPKPNTLALLRGRIPPAGVPRLEMPTERCCAACHPGPTCSAPGQCCPAPCSQHHRHLYLGHSNLQQAFWGF